VSSKPPNKADKHDKHEAVVVKRGGKGGHDDGHGGAWKVAFADFCLALMCLFLVLWLMAARKQDNIQQIMRAPGGSLMDEGSGLKPDSMGGPRGSLMEREPMPHYGETQATDTLVTQADPGPKAASAAGSGAGAASAASPAKHQYESRNDLLTLAQVLERMSVDAGLSSNLQSVLTTYGLRVMVHDTDKLGMFERGSAVPTERFRHLLQKMGPLFAGMSNQMLIVGHTDAVQYADKRSNAFSNWTLSSNRAMVSRALLTDGGMPASSILQVVGMADRAPIDAKDPTAGINRRIEMLILTSDQARVVSAMYGAPGEVQPLGAGADSAFPDRDALKSLRAQLIRTKGSGDDAN
jgi:chemotaxis protein MotB